MKTAKLFPQILLWATALVLVSMTSCQDELALSEETEQELTICIPFTIEPTTSEVVTRAPNEISVNDLYIIIFDANGAVKSRRHFTYTELRDEVIGSQPSTTGTANWVKIKTTGGVSHIYAFANLNGTDYLYIETLKNELDALTSRTQLLNLPLTLQEDLTRVGNTYLFTGKLENYNITNATISTIPLRRFASTYTFKINIGGNCTKFTAESYQLFNVPKKSYLIERAATKGVGIPCTWDAAQQASNFFTSKITTDFLNAPEGFLFYMVENRKNGLKAISGATEKAAYSLRDKQLKTGTGANITNGVYEYAPEFGTYMVLKGNFVGTSTVSGKTGPVEANVKYTIHLGYAEGANYTEKANDFFCNRNTQYTYNITVLGVNDIIVEVINKTETENAPSAEGDVIFTQGTTHYNLDAHYETVLLKFTKTQLENGKTQGDAFFTYKVSTPFTKLGAIDESWVRILRNDKVSNIYSTDFKNYPTTGYMTLSQLIAELKANANTPTTGFYDNNNEVVYTCHIDEFYYDTAPTGTPTTTGNLWRYFCNVDNREIQLLNSVELSPDKQSSITTAAYILSQKSIQTFYDVTNTSTFSAYGVESIDETGPLISWGKYPAQIGLYNTILDENTGQANFTKIIQQLRTKVGNSLWATYVNFPTNGYKSATNTTINAMKGDYNRAYLACLQRNRDLNGNNTLDDSEIKWYLPALNQYTGMFLGFTSLSDAAKLYTESTYIYKHFITSTARASTNLVVYWGEESVSTSCGNEYGMSKYASGGNTNDYIQNYYRCMRNLGTGTPVAYYAISGNEITTPYMNKNAYRTSIPFGEIGRHYNWENEAKLSANGIVFNTTTRPTSTIGAAMQFDLATSSNSACYTISPLGTWRAPNLRELYLLRVANALQANDVSRSIFKFASSTIPPLNGGTTATTQRRIGWYYNGSNLTMGNGSTTEGSHIRCVRDK